MSQNWEDVYTAAVLETDSLKVTDKLDSAIIILQTELTRVGSMPEHELEKRRIQEALWTLETIRRVEFEASA